MATLTWRTINSVDGDFERSSVVESGAKDAKGRRIGSFLVLEVREDGHSLRVIPTRDGKSFGPAPLPVFVEGALAEAKKAAEEML
jgi:hypothetical protein